MFTAMEELDEELVPFFENDGEFPMIRHPLVYSIFHVPVLNALVNQQLRAKKERIAELETDRRFDSILSLYERPYRLQALMKYADRMTDEEYWRNLGWIWTDTENFYQLQQDWFDAFDCGRPGRENMMGKADRVMYDALPETVEIYRGQSSDHACGMSWTTSEDTASWFAKRFERKNMAVLIGEVKKSNIIACKADRDENEVIAFPQHVRIIK